MIIIILSKDYIFKKVLLIKKLIPTFNFKLFYLFIIKTHF